MNLAALIKATLLETWPGGSAAPTAGTMKNSPLAIPNKNIETMSEAVSTAITVATAAGNPPIPISLVKITITGVGTDAIVGRYVSE